MKSVSAERVAMQLHRFVDWLDRHGETSHDHQSFFAGRWGGKAKSLYYRHPLPGAVAVAPMIFSEAFVPSVRRFFARPLRFPIADAHYAMGFALLFRLLGEPRHRERALHFAGMLEATRCPGAGRAGWGYPFDWVTRTGVIPANTPLITTTPYCYDAFAAVHDLDPHPRWLGLMQSAAEHAFVDIADRRISDDAASAGYHPHDREGGVVNASAYRAWLLTSAGLRFGRDDYLRAARRNLNYVLGAQREDGSWFYATDGVRDFVDHFHTCFVLKALVRIDGITGEGWCTRAVEAGVRYYVRHLFDGEDLPRPFARAPRLTVYRRELYDYAECINLATLLRGRFPALDERLASALNDLLSHWQKPDGSFRTRRLLLGWDETPMHRWAQAQLFRSLAQWLLAIRGDDAANAAALAWVPRPARAGAAVT